MECYQFEKRKFENIGKSRQNRINEQIIKISDTKTNRHQKQQSHDLGARLDRVLGLQAAKVFTCVKKRRGIEFQEQE